jgi:hypothetical protein
VETTGYFWQSHTINRIKVRSISHVCSQFEPTNHSATLLYNDSSSWPNKQSLPCCEAQSYSPLLTPLVLLELIVSCDSRTKNETHQRRHVYLASLYILPPGCCYEGCTANSKTIRSRRLKRSHTTHPLLVTRDKSSRLTNSTLTSRPLVSTGVTAFGTHISITARPRSEVKDFPSTIEQLRNLRDIITRD